MIATGLPLVKGFSILAAQSKNKKMKAALFDIGEGVGKGKSLSDSFRKYPDIFSDLYVSMIQSGEESGTLEDVLKILSLQLEKEKEMKAKVQKALIYPFILVSVMMTVGLLLMIFVLPKMKVFFDGLGADLPLSTKIILGAGDFFFQYWHFLILGLFVLALISAFLLRTKTGKFIIDTVLLKIPVVSSLVKKSNSASFIRSLSSLMASGVPLIKSLQITIGTVSNFYFKQALADVAKRIEKGEKLFASLSPHQNLFPYGMVEMVEIGEETGRTSLILKKLAEFYEEEVSNAADNLSVIIEPALIVVIGLAVGVVAISIMGPMYSVLGTI
jgi:type IV pilus assembly protein PilC